MRNSSSFSILFIARYILCIHIISSFSFLDLISIARVFPSFFACLLDWWTCLAPVTCCCPTWGWPSASLALPGVNSGKLLILMRQTLCNGVSSSPAQSSSTSTASSWSCRPATYSSSSWLCTTWWITGGTLQGSSRVRLREIFWWCWSFSSSWVSC